MVRFARRSRALTSRPRFAKSLIAAQGAPADSVANCFAPEHVTNQLRVRDDRCRTRASVQDRQLPERGNIPKPIASGIATAAADGLVARVR